MQKYLFVFCCFFEENAISTRAEAINKKYVQFMLESAIFY